VHVNHNDHITSWNNLDINEFYPKNNNDMMQCVAWNEIALCKTKSIGNTKEDKYPCGGNFFFWKILKWKTIIYSYMKLRHE